jgi:large subunit ribosomal protein L4
MKENPVRSKPSRKNRKKRKTNMTKLQVYSAKGRKTGTVDLPKSLATKGNSDLLTQAIHVYEDRSHKGTSRVKTRGEVNATTAKMYRQKGTGNARHGSRRAPIFKGGGVAHGPKGIKRVLVLSKNLKESALRIALNLKAAEGKIVVVTKLDSIKKTKDAQALILQVSRDLGIGGLENVRVVLEKNKKEAVRVFRNIKSLNVDYWIKLNAADVYRSSLVILDEDSLNEARGKGSQKERKETQKLLAEAPVSKKSGKVAQKARKTNVSKVKSTKKSRRPAKSLAKKGTKR